MLRSFVFVAFLSFSNAENQNDSICNNFQANFDVKSVLGKWHVVAIIPAKLFPDQKEVTCHDVEFSETDEAGLRWLINNTFETSVPSEVEKIKGLIIRQKYDYGETFHVWAKAVEGVKGCFQQILTMDMIQSDFDKVASHDAVMQLHILPTGNKSGPFLVQMLWGKLISAVVYRRSMGVTQDELQPVFELLSTLRGPQRLPKICDVTVKDFVDEIEHTNN